MHDMMFGYDRLMRILEVTVLVYTPWALFIILRNHRTRKAVHKSESPDLLVRKKQSMVLGCFRYRVYIIRCICVRWMV